MVSHLSTFVPRRFEELHALLNARGYLLDFGGRNLPRWEDDPPLGLIHMRAVLLPGADEDEDEDADPDERISFTVTERWSEHPVSEAQNREGLHLCSYSYHAQAGLARVRYEFAVRVAALIDADKTNTWISTERFAPFLERMGGDRALALDLYLWHARIAGASLTTLHHFEVALRNAIDRRLPDDKPQTPIERSWLLDQATLGPHGIAKVRDVLARLKREGYPREHPHVIAALPFSFWKVSSHAATSRLGARDCATPSPARACDARSSNHSPTCTYGATASPTTTRSWARTWSAGSKR